MINLKSYFVALALLLTPAIFTNTTEKVEVIPTVPERNLEEYQLPSGVTKGITVGWTHGWSSAEMRVPNPKKSGFDGAVFIGKGVNQTFVHLDDWGASFHIGDDCGRIEIKNATIIGAKDMGIKYQSARGDWFVKKIQVDSDGDGELDDWEIVRDEDGKTVFDYKVLREEHNDDAVLALTNVRLVTDDKGTRTKWMVHTNGVDHEWEKVTVDAISTAEHALYAHGVAKKGIWWHNVFVDAIGAEACKVATRPWEAFFAPGAELVMDQCWIRNFGQPTSNWQSGGAVILQGSGLSKIILRRSIFQGRLAHRASDRPKDTLVSLSDGLSTVQNAENNKRRYYDVITGMEAGEATRDHAANGHVFIESCAFLSFGGKKSIQTQTLYPNYEQDFGIARHNIVRSFVMKNCIGLVGEWDNDGGYKATSTLKFVENDQVKITNCNTPQQLIWADANLGWPVQTEMSIYTPVGNGVLSKNR